MANKIFTSLMFLILSIMTLYFLGGVIPKVINLVPEGYEKVYLITFYWIGMFSVVALPQYWTWFTDEDINIISPIQSLGAFIVSTMAVAFVTIVTSKILNAIELSTTSGIIYTICFWIFALLVLYVPQVFIYEPLKERFT